MTKQYSDVQMCESFKKQLYNKKELKFDNIEFSTFKIVHSHALIHYDTNGFKNKNQDKITVQISNLVHKIFAKKHNSDKNKTIASKFTADIDKLISDLSHCSLRFIRCLKPN